MTRRGLAFAVVVCTLTGCQPEPPPLYPQMPPPMVEGLPLTPLSAPHRPALAKLLRDFGVQVKE